MTSLKVSWAITAVLTVMLAFVVFKFVTGSVEPTDDGRTAIIITAPEKDMVLAEMRTFLEGVQTIVTAVAENDMETVATTATNFGMGATGGESAQLVAKLPLDFKLLGLGVHKAFDDLSVEATDMGDPQIILTKLGDLMLQCTSCHKEYRFDVVAEGS